MLTASLVLTFILACQTPQSVPEHIQNISVIVKNNGNMGSGVIKIRNDSIYVWTCAHLLRDAKHVHVGLKNEKVVVFDHPKIKKELYEAGDLIGNVEVETEIIRYSEVADLALLKVIGKNIKLRDSVTFDPNPSVKVGEDLWHCGSLFGDRGINSVSKGVLSYKNRKRGEETLWQSTCVVYQGSSGGGIFLKNGKCIGLVQAMAGSNLNYFIPMSTIKSYATRAGVLFTIDDNIPVPDIAKFKKTNIVEEQKMDQDETLIKKILGL